MSEKEFNADELSTYDGKDGHQVYIAHDGRVIDVSASELWKTGLHMQMHNAGRDLTVDIQSAPHGLEVLDRYPQVGVFKKERVSERPVPKALSRILRLIPFLRRHPHPATVHFPIALMVCTSLFYLLYLITGNKSFDTTAFHCLVAGIIAIPLAMITGYFTWWLNYMARPVRQVTIKIWLSSIMMCIAVIAFLWHIADPAVIESLPGAEVIYPVLVFALAPLAMTIGFYGGTLTFPIEREE